VEGAWGGGGGRGHTQNYQDGPGVKGLVGSHKGCWVLLWRCSGCLMVSDVPPGHRYQGVRTGVCCEPCVLTVCNAIVPLCGRLCSVAEG
jgi:hypothetical protein